MRVSPSETSQGALALDIPVEPLGCGRNRHAVVESCLPCVPPKSLRANSFRNGVTAAAGVPLHEGARLATTRFACRSTELSAPKQRKKLLVSRDFVRAIPEAPRECVEKPLFRLECALNLPEALPWKSQ